VPTANTIVIADVVADRIYPAVTTELRKLLGFTRHFVDVRCDWSGYFTIFEGSDLGMMSCMTCDREWRGKTVRFDAAELVFKLNWTLSNRSMR
jgi:hypothetical protein